ncbi:glycoside hydrolase [Lederbergia ruris]|uniref:Glycoside hydrolase n=1 Tax=Lederbergia ruris TaxID=217495 RepID=A0ABQ4KGE9_9BACI|nr:glycoside hydrolase 43 family protein [Lederbergia ruris]GIN57053.1 glycoside hydrolase [Lederbergia ruris]
MKLNTVKEKQSWIADLGNGYYQNPILFADYSDPDVIRVGDDFYLISSSFASTPGIPVLHSKDLVNWEIISHVFDRLPYDYYDTVRHGAGAWAPSIRYHQGQYWVFFGIPDHGIFMSTAENPAGPWAPLHLVKEAKGWIDPCPFWDDDGQAYLVFAFAKSRCGIKNKLKMCRMKPDGTALLSDPELVFDGNANHPTIEGPKMYKRNGYYYIFAPAGGVKPGWQTVLRSKQVYGSYEDKIVLHQGKSPINGPHQGGLVELESGESWFIHFQDRDAYGRIVHMQPVRWENDWPIMGHQQNEENIGEPVLKWKKPNVGKEYPIKAPATSDEFKEEILGLQWQWEANHKPEWYKLNEETGLRLFAQPYPKNSHQTLAECPHVLCQKFPAPVFTVTTKFSFHSSSPTDQAGLVILGKEYEYIALNSDGLVHVAGTRENPMPIEEEKEQHLLDSSTVYLRVQVQEEAVCQFYYSVDGKDFLKIGDAFQAKKGHWVGAKIGLFCTTKEVQKDTGFVDVRWIRVENNGMITAK